MRKQLYRTEIEYLRIKNELSKEQFKDIINSLFKKVSINFEYYNLLDEISCFEDIESQLEGKLDDKLSGVIGTLSNILEIRNDLFLRKNYEALFTEIIKGEVVVFVGAGLSRILGYPSWNELGDAAINYMYNHGVINNYEKNRISNEISSPIKKLSILQSYCNKSSKMDYEEFYKNLFDFENDIVQSRRRKRIDELNRSEFENPYSILCDPLFGFKFITTNIDNEIPVAIKEHLENARSRLNSEEMMQLSSRVTLSTENEDFILKEYDYKRFRSSKKVAMIHGHVQDCKTYVFSSRDYIEKYADGTGLKDFLKQVFYDNTVLFIGYGLEELQILESIFNASKMEANNFKEHYSLVDTYINEANITSVQAEYLKESFNINVIPYFKDSDDFLRILKVLSSWLQEICDYNSSNVVENSTKIDRFLTKEEDVSLKEIIRIISIPENQPYLNQLFNRVEDPDYFDSFYEADLFNPNKFPRPLFESKGTKYPLYSPIKYLERIVEQNNKVISDDIIRRILGIIESVTEYEVKLEPKNINNRTGLFLIRLLAKVPSKFFNEGYIIKVLGHWIRDFNSYDWVKDSICGDLLPSLVNEDSQKRDIRISKRIIQMLFEKEILLLKEDYRGLLSSLPTFLNSIKNNDVFISNTSDDFIYFIADKLNFVSICDYKLPLFIESYGRYYRIKVQVISDKVVYYSVEELDKEGADGESIKGVIEEGKFSIDSYSDIDKFKDNLISKIKIVKFDPSSIKGDLSFIFSIGSYDIFEDDIVSDDLLRYDKFQGLLTNYLTSLLKGKASLDPVKAIPFFKELITKKYSLQVFRRVILFVIDSYWSDLKELFWDHYLNDDILDDDNSRLEKSVLSFLMRKIQDFDSIEIKRIQLFIDTFDNLYKYEDELRNNFVDKQKLKWFEYLQNEPFFEKQYKKLNNKYKLKSTYFRDIGRLKYSSGEISPISLEQLAQMTKEDLIDYLNNYREEKERFGLPSKYGLSKQLRRFVAANPDIGLTYVDLVNDIPLKYYTFIIDGLLESVREGGFKLYVHKILTDQLFNFLLSVSIETDFDDDKERLIGLISNIIEIVYRNSKDQIEKSFEARSLNLLKHFSEGFSFFKIEGSYHLVDGIEKRDYNINSSLNSTSGKLLFAIIEMALSKGRSKGDDYQGIRFDNELKKIFNEALENKNRDAFILFGWNLRQFIYLDEEFSYNWIVKVVEESDEHWKSFFGSWLSTYMKGCSKNLYSILKKHFIKAIDLRFQNDSLMRSIILAFYWGFEPIDGEIMNRLIYHYPLFGIKRVINYVVADFDDIFELENHVQYVKNIEKLWGELLKMTRMEEEIERVIFDLHSFSRYLTELDSHTFSNLEKSIKVFKNEYSDRGLIESLRKLEHVSKKIETKKYLSILILELARKGYYPRIDYGFGSEIYEIIEKLKDLGNDSINNNLQEAVEVMFKNSGGDQTRGIDMFK